MLISGVGVELIRGNSGGHRIAVGEPVPLRVARAASGRCRLVAGPTWTRTPEPGYARWFATATSLSCGRVERVSGGAGWAEHGAMVDFYQDRTPPMFLVGGSAGAGRTLRTRWVAVREDANGTWKISA